MLTCAQNNTAFVPVYTFFLPVLKPDPELLEDEFFGGNTSPGLEVGTGGLAAPGREVDDIGDVGRGFS